MVHGAKMYHLGSNDESGTAVMSAETVTPKSGTTVPSAETWWRTVLKVGDHSARVCDCEAWSPIGMDAPDIAVLSTAYQGHT